MEGTEQVLNIDLFILHPENYQTAISQDREYYFNFELIHSLTFVASSYYLLPITTKYRGTQRQFSENICSEDDLRSRIFGKFVVKFHACLPLLGFSNI